MNIITKIKQLLNINNHTPVQTPLTEEQKLVMAICTSLNSGEWRIVADREYGLMKNGIGEYKSYQFRHSTKNIDILFQRTTLGGGGDCDSTRMCDFIDVYNEGSIVPLSKHSKEYIKRVIEHIVYNHQTNKMRIQTQKENQEREIALGQLSLVLNTRKR